MSYLLEESVTEIRKCPKCNGKLEVHLAREPQQKGRIWATYRCTEPNCDFHDYGWETI